MFGADGETGRNDLQPTTAHDATSGSDRDDAYGYLEPGTESLRNVAYATLGQPQNITADQPEGYDPNSPYLPGNPYAGFLPPRSVD